MLGTSACVFADIETDSVIDDFNDEGVSILIRPNRYGTALEVFKDAVFDGILDKRLDAKRRNEEVIRLDVKDDIEPLVETEFLQREVRFEVLKFLIERPVSERAERLALKYSVNSSRAFWALL